MSVINYFFFLFIFTPLLEAKKKPIYPEKRIVIVTASYNNNRWVNTCLNSVRIQNYSNWHQIYIDDCSTDGTSMLVTRYIQDHPEVRDKITLICNKKREGCPLANQYKAIHSCKDDDIIIILDGDDKFAHRRVLYTLNKVYQDPNIWLTYGQFREYPSGEKGFCCEYPEEIISNNNFRSHTHIPSHLRTFYAGLFKKINYKDLLYDGRFFPMSGDIAAMFPMIEMASKGHFKFIPKVMYIYNADNPLNEHKVSKDLQRTMDLELRSRKPYEPVEKLFE